MTPFSNTARSELINTHELDVFCARDRLTCRAMAIYYIKNSIFLTNASLCTSRVYNKLANTAHLHATYVILVIRVGEFIIFANLSNQTRVRPPSPD